MYRKKEIVLIPHWIQEILARRNLNIQECLNMDTLKGIVSVEDLAGFAAAQQFLGNIYGAPIDAMGLEVSWNQNSTDAAREYIRSVINLHKVDSNTVEGVRSRLFSPDVLSNNKDKIPFITYDLSPTALGVVIQPGFFSTTPNRNLQFSLVETTLSALYESCDRHVVNATPLFRKYLELLSERLAFA